MSYRLDSFKVYIRDEEMLRAMKRCLRHVLANTPASIQINPLNVRVFVAVYLIVYKRESAFQRDGDLERTLFAEAQILLRAFDTIVDYVAHQGTFEGAPFLASFRTSLNNYFTAYEAWDAVEKILLKPRINKAIIRLTEAWLWLPADLGAECTLRSEIRAQLRRLRGKITQKMGPEGHRELEEQLAALSLPVIDPA
jgi:hypothetical protein